MSTNEMRVSSYVVLDYLFSRMIKRMWDFTCKETSFVNSKAQRTRIISRAELDRAASPNFKNVDHKHEAHRAVDCLSESLPNAHVANASFGIPAFTNCLSIYFYGLNALLLLVVWAIIIQTSRFKKVSHVIFVVNRKTNLILLFKFCPFFWWKST